MNKEVFLLERVDDTKQENSFQTLRAQDAQKLIAEGKAVEAAAIHHIRAIDREVDELVKAYKQACDYIRNTDEPRYRNVPGQAEYEMRQMREELEEAIKHYEEQKRYQVEKFYEEAMLEKANATRYIPETDKEASRVLIEQLSNEAKYGDTQSAIDEFREQLKYMSDTRKKAVALEFSKFAAAIESQIEETNDDSRKRALKRQLRELYRKVTDINDPAYLKARMAEALKKQGTTFPSYTFLKLTHRTYKS
jgi:hypothetical protein